MVKVWRHLLVLVAVCLVFPALASAQSIITGIVRDASDAVLPGVTVEVASPALIESARTTITDGAGGYRVIDLRPGTYSVTFTLPGFTTVRREGLALEANFTANIDAKMTVGGIEETLTVSGQAPVVDIESTTRRDVLSRDLIDTLPTGRTVYLSGNVLPSVTMARFDIGGSSTMQNNFALMAAGSQSGDTRHLMDGMLVNSILGTGNNVPSYYNDDNFETTVFTLVGGNAENETPGVHMNMIPKTGGNRFNGNATHLYADKKFQANNYNEALRGRTAEPPRLSKLWDFNASLGGPIMQNRLWFFSSYRNWGYNNFLPIFNPGDPPTPDSNVLWTLSGRLTAQLNDKNRITVFNERYRKNRSFTGAENGRTDPSATGTQWQPIVYNAQVKWTNTVSSKLLVEAGHSMNFFRNYSKFNDPESLPTASNPIGRISKLDLNSQRLYDAPANGQDFTGTIFYESASMTYVTSGHQMKIGGLASWGRNQTINWANGDLQEQYRCPTGVRPGPGCTPVQVVIRNTPTDSLTDLNMRIALFAQDSWNLKRLTVNPGIRFDSFRGGVPEQSVGEGYFVPARTFAAIENLPNWKNVSLRFGASYDLFGDGRTAVKGSIGQYMQGEQIAFAQKYNPMITSTDTRTWGGARDGLGLPTNLGPSQNALFGRAVTQRPEENIRRPYQMVYNIGVQRELWGGAAISANWYRREYRRMITTENLAVPFSAYTPIDIADPRGNGQMITVHNLLPEFLGRIDYLDRTSPSNRMTFTGYDVYVNVRGSKGASLGGGVMFGRFVNVLCDVTDPNQLRFCDQRGLGIPWAPTLKLNGVYRLPYDFSVSGVLQSAVGFSETNFGLHDVGNTYLVSRAVVPTLTQAQVTGKGGGFGNPVQGVLLDAPGSNFLPRVTMLDLALMRTFRFRNMSIVPQLDMFNVFNANTVTSVVTNFGPSMGDPATTLTGRLSRLRVSVRF